MNLKAMPAGKHGQAIRGIRSSPGIHHVILPAIPSLKIKADVPAILALVRMCKTNGMDASSKPIDYKDGDIEAVRAFNVGTINCVIGRVKMGKWWGIIDRSFGPLRINIYDLQEPEYESEDNFSISCM
jgi:hypothetical protein